MEPMRLLVTDAAAQPPRQATAWLIMTLGYFSEFLVMCSDGCAARSISTIEKLTHRFNSALTLRVIGPHACSIPGFLDRHIATSIRLLPRPRSIPKPAVSSPYPTYEDHVA
jgi:hypothetical protein